LAGAVASMFVTGGAYADGAKIVTRSPEAAQADLVRDWNGPSKATIASEERSFPQTRTAQQAYDDLMRNWNWAGSWNVKGAAAWPPFFVRLQDGT
jgi:hypothetical protein